MTRTIMLRDGRRATALEIQWGLLERARKYEQLHGLACVDEEVGRDVLAPLGARPHRARARPGTVAPWVDWVAKQRLVDGYAERHDIAPGVGPAEGDRPAVPRPAPRARAWPRGPGSTRSSTRPTSRRRSTEPPTSTRAYFRGRCLAKYPDEIVAANWDSIVFDVGREPLRRVPMMEPLRGTADHVARLIDESDTAVELLERLGS